MEINGKKVVVIGGASGMGRASAELLHARGASVAIFDREGSTARRSRPASVATLSVAILIAKGQTARRSRPASVVTSTRWTSPTSPLPRKR